MQSHLDEANLLLKKLQSDHKRVSVTARLSGVLISAKGRIADVCLESFRVDNDDGCCVLVDWSSCPLEQIEYVEPDREIDAATLSALGKLEFSALWEFTLASGDFFLLAELR